MRPVDLKQMRFLNGKRSRQKEKSTKRYANMTSALRSAGAAPSAPKTPYQMEAQIRRAKEMCPSFLKLPTPLVWAQLPELRTPIVAITVQARGSHSRGTPGKIYFLSPSSRTGKDGRISTKPLVRCLMMAPCPTRPMLCRTSPCKTSAALMMSISPQELLAYCQPRSRT